MTFCKEALVLPRACVGVWTMAGAAALQDAAMDADAIAVVGRGSSQANEAAGFGEPSSTVAVKREALLSERAGASGLKMREQAPGFNVQTDGALSLCEFGNSTAVRALSLSQLGLAFDGASSCGVELTGACKPGVLDSQKYFTGNALYEHAEWARARTCWRPARTSAHKSRLQ